MIFAGELSLPTVIPVEVVLLFVGAYAIPSLAILGVALLLVTAADLAGTTLLYLALCSSGRRLVARYLRRHGERSSETADRWGRRGRGHDVALVFVGRMVPLVRIYVPFGAALRGLAPRPYLLGAAPGGAIWAATPLVAGYLFRADVQQIAAGYSRLAHTLLYALPIAVGLTVAAWWIRAAEEGWARLYRGRAALGLAAVVATGVYLATTVAENDRAADGGATALSLPLLLAWLALLTGLAGAVAGVALVDLRAGRRRPASQGTRREREVLITLVWVGLLAIIGGIMLGLELHYPRL